MEYKYKALGRKEAEQNDREFADNIAPHSCTELDTVIVQQLRISQNLSMRDYDRYTDSGNR